jgi:hypothetical protein
MDRRTFILGLGSIAAGFPSSSHAQSLPSQVDPWQPWKEIPTIVILSTEDAIVRSFRLILAGDLVALKARTLSPALVNSMREANGDVIVALSDDAGFDPFAFPWPALRKVLVAIPSFRKYPFWPSIARNVAAHELGHALGLDHNDEATSLMCGGTAQCDGRRYPNNGFAPLTSTDKTKLLEKLSAELAVEPLQAVEGGSTGWHNRLTGRGRRTQNGTSHALYRPKAGNGISA